MTSLRMPVRAKNAHCNHWQRFPCFGRCRCADIKLIMWAGFRMALILWYSSQAQNTVYTFSFGLPS
jgi:hypothetical protein